MKVRALLVAIAVAVPAMVSAPPATAVDADTFVMQGSGTILPGLTLVPQQQNLSFSGTATVVGTGGVLSTYSCSFVGNDLAGSTAESVGTMSGGCGPWWCDVWVYVRVGGFKKWICIRTGNPQFGLQGMNCVWTPTDVNPTTRYSLVCHGIRALAP
jgi:hypothetical protein